MDFRRHEVGEAIIRLAVGLLNLLTKEMKRRQHLGSRFVGVKLDVVADAVRGKQTIDASWMKPFPAYDLVEQLLRVGKEFASFFAMFLVVQDCWIAAAQLPGVKKRRPIDEGDEV